MSICILFDYLSIALMSIYCRFLSDYTDLPVETVEEECDRENFLNPKKAIEFGIIDGIIE